jgi:hypothetical protein
MSESKLTFTVLDRPDRIAALEFTTEGWGAPVLLGRTVAPRRWRASDLQPIRYTRCSAGRGNAVRSERLTACDPLETFARQKMSMVGKRGTPVRQSQR